jgi:hypothetical protein
MRCVIIVGMEEHAPYHSTDGCPCETDGNRAYLLGKYRVDSCTPPFGKLRPSLGAATGFTDRYVYERVGTDI